jgi:hypothetical protein
MEIKHQRTPAGAICYRCEYSKKKKKKVIRGEIDAIE